MKLAVIRGYVTSTVKHSSFDHCRLLIAEPVDNRGKVEGAPQIVLDDLGAGLHQTVILCADGGHARKMLNDPRSPARWWVMGIVDPEAAAV